MSALRRCAVVIAACVSLALTAGCQNDGDGSAQPLPPVESSTNATEARTPGPTEPTRTAWQDNYTNAQIAAYEEALDRFATYEQRAEPIWRRGMATPAAEELFREYFYTWQTELNRLELYERANVEVHGTPTVLESRPARVALADDGESVTIRQCVDYSTVTGFQNGEETEKVATTPQVRIIVTSRSLGSQATSWRISRIQKFEGDRPCTP